MNACCIFVYTHIQQTKNLKNWIIDSCLSCFAKFPSEWSPFASSQLFQGGATLVLAFHFYKMNKLGCIKDWISTVLVVIQVTCNISGKENAMGMWCDIQSHLTKPCPFPYPKLWPHIFNTFVPAKCTKLLICRSNCSHFSSWIQVSLRSTGFLVGGWTTGWEFPRNGETRHQKYTLTQTVLY